MTFTTRSIFLSIVLCAPIMSNAKYEIMMPSKVVYDTQSPKTIPSQQSNNHSSGKTNSPPVAVDDDEIITSKNTSIDKIDVLSNDFDPDSDLLTITEALSSNGNLDIKSDKTLKYTPNPDFYGIDIVTYKISDGQGGVDSADIKIVVNNTEERSPLSKQEQFSEGSNGFKLPFGFSFESIKKNQAVNKVKSVAEKSQNIYKNTVKEIKSEIKDFGCKFVYQKYIVEKQIPKSYPSSHNWNNWSSFDIKQFEDLILKCK